MGEADGIRRSQAQVPLIQRQGGRGAPHRQRATSQEGGTSVCYFLFGVGCSNTIFCRRPAGTLKIRTGESASTALRQELRPRERAQMLRDAVEKRMAVCKDQDHHWEDQVDVSGFLCLRTSLTHPITERLPESAIELCMQIVQVRPSGCVDRTTLRRLGRGTVVSTQLASACYPFSVRSWWKDIPRPTRYCAPQRFARYPKIESLCSQ